MIIKTNIGCMNNLNIFTYRNRSLDLSSHESRATFHIEIRFFVMYFFTTYISSILKRSSCIEPMYLCVVNLLVFSTKPEYGAQHFFGSAHESSDVTVRPCVNIHVHTFTPLCS